MADVSATSSDARARMWLVELAGERRLSPTQRRVVQHIVNSLPEISYASALEVATSAGVSQPTVTRVANALGFEGYHELRGKLRALLVDQAGGNGVADSVEPNHVLVEAESRNVAELNKVFAGEDFERAAHLIAENGPLGVIGLRASAAIANYFGYFAGRVLPGVRVLDDGSSIEDHLLQLHLDGSTVVLAFAMPRYPAKTVAALEFAQSLGMKTIVVTNASLAPFTATADISLVTQVGSTLVFDSHAATIVLSIALLDRVASLDSPRTQARLEAHERIVDRWVI